MPSNKEYQKMVEKVSPNSSLGKNMLMAFLIGGLICSVGQAFVNLYTYLDLPQEKASTLASVTLVFLAILLTGLRRFDNLAKIGGAGALVPITGFANAMSSPAIEFKTEGFVLGVGANIFKIAGPVIAYGTAASVIYGVIYWLTTLF